MTSRIDWNPKLLTYLAFWVRFDIRGVLLWLIFLTFHQLLCMKFAMDLGFFECFIMFSFSCSNTWHTFFLMGSLMAVVDRSGRVHSHATGGLPWRSCGTNTLKQLPGNHVDVIHSVDMLHRRFSTVATMRMFM